MDVDTLRHAVIDRLDDSWDSDGGEGDGAEGDEALEELSANVITLVVFFVCQPMNTGRRRSSVRQPSC